ncbi:unnamed protein product, partial [marine sediment metagenome]
MENTAYLSTDSKYEKNDSNIILEAIDLVRWVG